MTFKTPLLVLSPPESGKKKLNRWTLAIVIIGILIVGVLFSLIYYSTDVVSSKTFAYTAPSDQQGSYSSLSISNLDGLVSLLPWSGSTILINGTITAKGLGSSLSAVSVVNSADNGNIVLSAKFPVGGGILFSQIYTVNITAFIPQSQRLNSLQVSNINGGVIVETVNSTSLSVTTVNGAISVNCVYCVNVTAASTNGDVTATFSKLAGQGKYNLTATNANIAFTAPESSSFTLDARVLNGSILFSGFTCGTCITGQKTLTHIFGTGAANVYVESVNGQISINGT